MKLFHLTSLVLLLAINCQAGVHGGSHHSHGGNCFEHSKELRQAVVQYCENSSSPESPVAVKYGWPIGNWCVSKITNFSYTFAFKDSFNEDISSWDMSNAETAQGMFFLAEAFNQDIGQWKVGKVRVMRGIFARATSFDQDVSHWNTSNVEDLGYAFRDTVAFSGHSLASWDTSNVKSFKAAFLGANHIDGLDEWDVSAGTDFSFMFHMSKSFHGDISRWNVSRGVHFDNMFSATDGFNADLSAWDVASNGKNFASMFDTAAAFNQDLCMWEASFSDKKQANVSVTVAGMFNYTACPSTADPMFTNSAVGPFCHYCSTGPCHGDDCLAFHRNGELHSAVRGYLQDSSSLTAVAKTYGAVIGDWKIEKITSLNYLFDGATHFNENLSKWQTSRVTTMIHAFRGASSFNQPLATWDVSKVEQTRGLFWGAASFDQDISSWDMSKVQQAQKMFRGAVAFNHDISSWNVQHMKNVKFMFSGATSFNQDISKWELVRAKDMKKMFKGALSFNQDLCRWNQALFTANPRVIHMFDDTSCESSASPVFTRFSLGPLCRLCPSKPCNGPNGSGNCIRPVYNAELRSAVLMYQHHKNPLSAVSATYGWPINTWDTSEMSDFSGVFRGVRAFNEDISGWNTSRAESMNAMFEGADRFNVDLSNWDVSKVRDFGGMFLGAKAFNADISNWNVVMASNMTGMFLEAKSFDHNLCTWLTRNHDVPVGKKELDGVGCSDNDQSGKSFCQACPADNN